MRRTRDISERVKMPLHPAIKHINASPEFLSKNENIKLINEMVEKVFHLKKSPKI